MTNRVTHAEIMDRLNDVEGKLDGLTDELKDFGEVVDTLKSIGKYVKLYVPIIATAAISSGVISGNWGTFLASVFGG